MKCKWAENVVSRGVYRSVYTVGWEGMSMRMTTVGPDSNRGV
jgi:hypothetical protein